MKTCLKCKEVKPVEAFWKCRGAKDGLRYLCKPCQLKYKRVWNQKNPLKAARHNRKGQLKHLFGLTLMDYEKLLQEQGGVCKICGGEDQNRKRLAVDHDHTTGKVRGLLCRFCNTALGLLGESPERLRAAANYLTSAKKANAKEVKAL